jgi:hypothetical protein
VTRTPRAIGRFVVSVLLVIWTSSRVNAQPAAGAGNDGTGVTLSRSELEDLPSSGTISGLLETTIPEIISDRIEGGGLSVGSESRLGAWGSSWTQTGFQFGDLDFTDPGVLGPSLLFLNPSMLERVETVTAMMPIEESAPGLVVHLTPRRPSDAWVGGAEFLSTLLSPSLSTQSVAPASAIDTWNRLSATASGAIRRNRVNITVGAAATNATRFDRADPTRLHSQQLDAYGQLLVTPSAHDEVSGVVVGRSAHGPLAGRLWIDRPEARQRVSDILAASSWQHRTTVLSLTAAGGFWRSTTNSETVPSSIAYVDSIRDMPIMDAVSASRAHQRWSAVLRVSGATDNAHRLLRNGRAGIEIEHGTAADDTLLAPAVAETVEGFPARLWRFSGSVTEPRATTVSAYGAERVPLSSRITIDAGMRWEAVTAAGAGGASIDCSNWFPRASLRWSIVSNERLSGVVGLSRYGHRLPPEILSYADLNGRSAEVFRWSDLNGDTRFEPEEQGALVSYVGARPPASSEIDPRLRRPYLDELLLGVDATPGAAWSLRFTGITRRERELIAWTNPGVPVGAYVVTTVADPGGDLLDPSDDQQLPVFNRRPETFGADRYVLTNPAGFNTTFHGIELSVRHSGDRFWMMAGATAGRSSGPAAARGFHVFQNDDAIPGDVLSNPNAATFAQGSLFSDRSYTIKTAGTYRFPHDVRVGIVARYQDGQPFARLVVAQDLNQGAEAIRAYRNGRTRFAYTLTTDARLQVPFTAAGLRLVAVWDVFNLLNLSNEVEEYVVTGPDFRAPAALQPPRAMHLGVRIAF